jgi:hypothetical protein
MIWQTTQTAGDSPATKGGQNMKNRFEKKAPDQGRKVEEAESSPQKRLLCDRRKNNDRGYIYISTVGWIDRRENSRRSSDSYMAMG